MMAGAATLLAGTRAGPWSSPMDLQLLVICLLTAGTNLVGTLPYAARIAGVPQSCCSRSSTRSGR